MSGQDAISRSTVDAPPADYVVKIQSFSLLAENSIERYESGQFEAGGYKWKLAIYPGGNKRKNVMDHISLYLVLDDTSSLHHGWEIYVHFRFFLYDQNNDNYLLVQEDNVRKERRFHKMKVEWGFDQFIPLEEFNLDAKGYLVDDTCAFGAEVFVRKDTGKGECLIMMKDAITYLQRRKFLSLSKLGSECFDSKSFNAGNYKWKIKLYPNGKGAEMGNYLSLYLALADPSALSPGCKIYARIILRILDQKQAKYHIEKAKYYWFGSSKPENGYSRFMSIDYFTDAYWGYLLNDSCVVGADIKIIGVVDAFT